VSRLPPTPARLAEDACGDLDQEVHAQVVDPSTLDQLTRTRSVFTPACLPVSGAHHRRNHRLPRPARTAVNDLDRSARFVERLRPTAW